MFCTKCGTDNSETAIYCRKCGGPMDAEEETRFAVRDQGEAVNRSLPDDESISAEARIFSIRPTLMFVKAGYVLAAVGALLLVAIFSVVAPSIPVWIDSIGHNAVT